jgi:Na+/H+ antiporter NhaD/arsenite permease-like protein
MMIMVEGMAEAGFFRWLCMRIAKLVHYKPTPLLVSFMVMSFCLAMFIDSITVILFLAAVTVELAKMLKFDPVPMILSEIFCANLGGSATMCGDPPNIIIGTALHLSFFDFLSHTGLIAFVSMFLVIGYFYMVYRKELATEEVTAEDIAALPDPKSAIKNSKEFTYACIIFACAVVMLVTHAQTGLTVAFIGTFVSLLTVILFHKDVVKILKKVDYKTLMFFVGLFIVVSGLEATGFEDGGDLNELFI